MWCSSSQTATQKLGNVCGSGGGGERTATANKGVLNIPGGGHLEGVEACTPLCRPPCSHRNPLLVCNHEPRSGLRLDLVAFLSSGEAHRGGCLPPPRTFQMASATPAHKKAPYLWGQCCHRNHFLAPPLKGKCSGSTGRLWLTSLGTTDVKAMFSKGSMSVSWWWLLPSTAPKSWPTVNIAYYPYQRQMSIFI